MRPILFNKNETVFDTYGLGELNVTKGTATRECNGNYTLYAEIPVNDPMVSILQKEMKLKADAGLRTKNQTFEISRIVKDSSKIVKIYGQHISHKLEYMAIRNHTILNGTAQSALGRWKDALIGDYSFDVWSDIQTSATTTLNIDKVTNARLALGGVEGSILDVWGGEYEFDNMTIRLHKRLGRTAPTILEYGRNILSAESDETIESAYTSVLPFATYTPDKPEGDTSDSQPDSITITIPEDYVDSKYKALYAHRRIKVIDFSSEFNSDSKKKNIPTADKLRKLATDYMERNSIGKPKINTKIEYVDLAKTLDYADRAWIEELELCDIVPIYYPQIGLTDDTAKVTTITYDFVNERNASVEFGEIGTNVRATMQSGLAGQVNDIAKAQKDFENSLPNYLLNAQGNKVWYNRPDDGIEHKVGDIWFEKNGLYDRMYIWNGSMWEKRIDTEDVDKVKKEVDKQLADSKQATDDAMAKTRAIADLALHQSGTDSIELASKRVVKQVLDGRLFDSGFKKAVTKTFEESDNGSTIYGKISSEIEKKFITIDATDSRFRQVSEQVSQTNKTLTSVRTDLGQARTDIDNTRLYIRDANTRIDQTNTKVAEITRQIEVQVQNYNAVRESTKLYERILGTSETGAPDKLSRLVMSSEIFQTEVGKYSTTGGPNMLRNSRADDGLKYWTVPTGEMTFTAHSFYFNGQKRMFSLRPGAVVKSPRFIVKRNIDYTLNILGFDNNSKYFKIYFCKRKKGSTSDFEEKQLVFDGRPQWTDGPVFNSTKVVKKSFKFNIGEFDDGYLQFEYDRNNPNKWGGLFMTELDFYEGANDRKWQPAPEDSAEPIEAVRTQVTQLAGSWSVRNINSAGDVLNSINLLANGTNRIDGRLTHITGQTIIDNAVIKDGMIDKVSANKMTTGTLDANKVNLINLNAKSVTSGTFKGLTFEGGIIRGNNGNTEINLNSNVTTYNGTAKIEFKSPHNSLEFNSNGRKAFLAPTISLGSNYPAFAFGINDQGEANSNKNFVGFKIFNQPAYRKIVLIGDVHIVKDSVNENAPYVSLVDLFNRINDNFKKLHAFRVQYNEGSPGFFDVSL
nr:MAG TPA: tail protein [Caudoviricetes sp.]